MENHFNLIKDAYFKAREIEWEKLRSYLKEQNMEVVFTGRDCGHGKNPYISNGKLNIGYNLSNWRWIDIKTGNITIFVTFQPQEKDDYSDNVHTLFDRIGLSWYIKQKNTKKETKMILENLIITDIELPLNNEKLITLNKLICDIADKNSNANLED